jgi:hypothetical protein
MLRRILLQEILDQPGKILFALTQGRHANVDYVQTIKKIFSKTSDLHRRIEIYIRQRNQTSIELDSPATTQPLKLTSLNYPQQLRLSISREMRDLVEHDRALLRGFETPRFWLDSTGKSAALKTKELCFEQLTRQRRAIDLHERLCRATRSRMNESGEQVLSYSRLTRNQNVRIGCTHALRETDSLAHLGGARE